jgi:riboflavin biosynthesis pyrimidine reductase
MRQLLPVPVDEVDLASAYAYPAELDGSFVRANMVTSADGAATVDGRAAALGGASDKLVFDLLRGLCDAVVVGAGTARVEGYRVLRAQAAYASVRETSEQTAAPVLVLVSRQLDLEPDSQLFADAAERTVVITHGRSDADRRAALSSVAHVIVAGDEEVDIGAALDALAARGLHRILCEGGPHLLGDVAAADRLDELCLTVTPQLVGGDATRVVAGAHLGVDLRLAHLIEDDGMLFARYVCDPRPIG